MKLRTLVLRGDPVARGHAHGQAFAAEIREYADERVRLASNGSWAGRRTTRQDVLGLADAMLPAHRAYAPDLVAELEAMAAGAGISAAEALICGGFTDFVDAVRAVGSAPVEDTCTAALVPDSRADGAGFLAQTWDMHASATSHVLLLDLHPDRGPAARIFTTVGCLAQIGMNAAGIAVGINNLTAADGRIGVTWPFVVREALAATDLDAALARVLAADLAGGHNYLLMDADGRGYNVEAMPTQREVTALGEEPLLHTNHPLDPGCAAREAKRPADLVASSVARLARGRELLSQPHIDVAALMAFTREPEWICRSSEPPHHMETSGAVILRPRSREMWAVWGLPSENTYERFTVDA
jgi:isopenicillin-N N-acyltransferase-like protein